MTVPSHHTSELILKVSGRKLLDHAGTVSADDARTKAEREHAPYRSLLDAQPRAIDAEFFKVAKLLKPAPLRPKRGRRG